MKLSLVPCCALIALGGCHLIDWKWYGTPDTNTADITRVIPEVDMLKLARNGDAVGHFQRQHE